MKEKNVIGIASDKTMLLGLNGYIKEDCLIIDDVMCASRKHTLEEDCEAFVHRFSLEGERMAVAAVSAYRCGGMEIPRLSRQEAKDMLHWQLEDTLEWDKDTYYSDFMLRAYEEAGEKAGTDYLYWVVLPKVHVDALATGYFRGGGDVRIIDYWPSPLSRVFEETGAKALMWPEGEGWRLTVWRQDICYVSLYSEADEASLRQALQEAEQAIFLVGLSGIDGIYAYTEAVPYDGMSIEASEQVFPESLYNEYGMLSHASYQCTNRAVTYEEKGSMLWDMALGLVRRGLGMKTYD